jgi:hypothetical protein
MKAALASEPVANFEFPIMAGAPTIPAHMRLFLLPLLLIWGASALADGDLLSGSSFESPVIKGRTLKDAGGDPTRGGKGPWVVFKFLPAGGKVTGGLTNEVARTGAQSLFIRFDHAAASQQSAVLVSNFIPIASGSDYEVGIWGRTDAKDVIDSAGRSAYLKLEVDFFAADANESVGDPFYQVIPIPGGRDRPPTFTPDKWNRFAATLTTPPGAVFAQIIWRWETGGDSGDKANGDTGEVNGVIYFDDAAMTGPPAPIPNLTPAPVQEDDSTPAPSAAPQ